MKDPREPGDQGDRAGGPRVPRRGSGLPHAVASKAAIARRLEGNRAALFLDYDGTLTPIVAHPEDATLSGEMRAVLRQLAACCTVAIISGRDLGDVQLLVGLDELFYAGSHGFEIRGPHGVRLEHEEGSHCLPELDDAEQELQAKLGSVSGANVERKRFAIAVHYRNVADSEVPFVQQIVRDVLGSHGRLRRTGGKKIFELRPNIHWHKGRAVLWLLEALELARADVLPIYFGDDLTDEDAFEAVSARGIGVLVGVPSRPTSASHHLRDTREVQVFLGELVSLLRGK